jgi:hypothetical protein
MNSEKTCENCLHWNVSYHLGTPVISCSFAGNHTWTDGEKACSDWKPQVDENGLTQKERNRLHKALAQPCNIPLDVSVKTCENCGHLKFDVGGITTEECEMIRNKYTTWPDKGEACSDWKPKPDQRKVRTEPDAAKTTGQFPSLLTHGSGSAAEKALPSWLAKYKGNIHPEFLNEIAAAFAKETIKCECGTECPDWKPVEKGKPQEIVINKCWGGFGLSQLAIAELKKLGCEHLKEHDEEKWFAWDKEHGSWKDIFKCSWEKYKEDQIEYLGIAKINGKLVTCEHRNENRDCKHLVAVVKKLGAKANGRHAELKVVSVPAVIKWVIDEYDGQESIEEEHRSWG